MDSTAESQALVRKSLDSLQRNRGVRIALGACLVAAMLLVAGRSIYRLIPRHYTLSLTGGDIVNNRHFLARILQAEAAKVNLTLVVTPVSSGLDSLERVSQGTLDMAFVQGGLERPYPNVEHVATIMPELVHLLVKPGIPGLGDLKGRSINMGIRDSAARSVALTLVEFAGYRENVDYVETNYTAEQLLALPLRKMPDAILTVSSVPSYMVEILVHKFHYQVVEIPFPEALALRHGWAENGKIFAYTYDLSPPVPEKNIETVAVNMHLVASSHADPAAISRLLEVLYSPGVQNRLLQPLDEKRMMVPSGFPISPGVTAYLHRNDSLLTMAMWNQAQGIFGLILSFGGMALVILKWLKGAPPEVQHDDEQFFGYLAEVVAIEKRSAQGQGADRAELGRRLSRLGELRIEMLERYPKANLKDPDLFDRCVEEVRAAQEQVRAQLGESRRETA